MVGWLHGMRRWGHTIVWWELGLHRGEFTNGNFLSHKRCLQQFSIFWATLEFRVYDIWEEFMRECCQNELEMVWSRCLSVVHLDMEEWRGMILLPIASHYVHGLAKSLLWIKWGEGWKMWIGFVLVRAHGLTDPTLASLSTLSLPLIPMWNNTSMSCTRWGCFEMLCMMVSRGWCSW